MRTTNRGYILSTGRTIDANHHILGLDLNNRLSHGYDGYIDLIHFTAEEKKEIAKYMIKCWSDWGGLDLVERE